MNAQQPPKGVINHQRQNEIGPDLVLGQELPVAGSEIGREHIGNLADPALAARDAVHFIGLPEGALALSQAVVYMALAPKSNALYKGYKMVQKEVGRGHNPPVPLHIRNAPTSLMKDLGYGEGYAYAHDHADGMTEMTCLPDSLQGRVFYEPGGRGFESELKRRMQRIDNWLREKKHKAARPEGEQE